MLGLYTTGPNCDGDDRMNCNGLSSKLLRKEGLEPPVDTV